MPQSLANIYIHTVFSTKNREPFLAESVLRREMHAYLTTVAKQLECQPICIGGVEDHVHLLTKLSRTTSTADFVKEVKRVSSLWMGKQGVEGFYWQAGYGVFSVSHSQLQQVIHYIENQETHHAQYGFQDEFRKLLRLHEIEFDERYLWD